MMKKQAMFTCRERKEETLENVVFVDPGLGGTGWALFQEFTTNARVAIPPAQSGVIRAPGNEQWQNAAWSIASAFRGVLAAVKPRDVVLEMPELWSGSATSMASMTHKAEEGEPSDLCKLIFLVGGLAQAAREDTGNLPILVSPAEWKGQLPKDAVLARIKKALGPFWRVTCKDGTPAKIRDHEADAIGMGIAAQGAL